MSLRKVISAHWIWLTYFSRFSFTQTYIFQLVIKVGCYFWSKNTQWIKRFILSYWPSKLAESEEFYECTFNLTCIFSKIFLHSNIHISGCNQGKHSLLVWKQSVDQALSVDLLTIKIGWVWGKLWVHIQPYLYIFQDFPSLKHTYLRV